MPIDSGLMDVLACPSEDHAPLREQAADGSQGADGAVELVCTVCASRFPVRDGIPVLLMSEATPGPNGLGRPATQ